MDTPDKSRRELLIAAASMGAVAGAGFGAAPAAAALPAGPAHRHMAVPSMPSAPGAGAFFNDDEAMTVAAIAERIMPGAPGIPGAGDADVISYIDLALAGAYGDLQDFYRRGLAQLDAYCLSAQGKRFAELDGVAKDRVLGALEHNTAAEFRWPSAVAFFETLRTHTMEGMFADPVYGGNRHYAGWRLVGFPGAQEIFLATELESTAAFSRAPIIGLKS